MDQFDNKKNNTQENAGGIFTIKNSLFGIVAILVLIVVSFRITSVIDASNYKAELEKAIVINEFSDHLIEATNYFSLERGVMVIALGSEKAISSNFSTMIKENRSKGVAAYQKAMATFAEMDDFPRKKTLVLEVNENFEAYLDAQGDADRVSLISVVNEQDFDVKSSKSMEKSRSGRKFRRAIEALNSKVHEIRLASEFEANISNARIILYQQLKNSLAEMIEYSDREWTGLGTAISSKKSISENMITTMSSYGGRVNSNWAMVNALLSSSFIDEKLKSYAKIVNVDFFEGLRGLKDEIYDVSYDAAASQDMDSNVVMAEYPVTAAEWIDQANAANKSIQDLNKAVGNSARNAALKSESEANTQMITGIMVLITALLIGISAFWLVVKRITRPLTCLGDTMYEISHGDLDSEILGIDRRDEIGSMARSLQVFKEAAVEKLRHEAEEQKAAEERQIKKERKAIATREEEEKLRQQEEDRERNLRETRQAEMLALADNFESSVMEIVSSVAAASSEMEKNARDMSSVAEETTHQATSVTAASEQTSSNIQTVASAAEELSASVKEISQQIIQSNEYSSNAVSETEKATVEIQGLVEAAQKIGDVISLINDIAEQTNLLALNATIEAARAGEAGKGFAVVASEVKSLASQTATATDEITIQVGSMRDATEKAVSAIAGIQNVIKRIDDTSISISSAMEEQDASTQEIARNVSEVSAGTQEVTSNIHVMSDGAKSTGTAANAVLDSAHNMSAQSAELRLQLEKFLEKIRAA
ncbi:Methyl-accepting chemotaxis protein [hydrothermal vent metagenome]|uniref:Methyl-accepting chemotaxis protein n=1 Tax=hydrothermal vent metagenome TaxID=652676 RepID=A0A3B1BF09_9ZZZZ